MTAADFRCVLQQIDCEFAREPVLADELRNWIRPEAEAAMSLPVKSPSVDEGPYAEVDIGAGTTNASIFSIVSQYRNRRWVKDRLMFFGAYSEPAGMDSVDAAIARVEAGHDWYSLRGRERRFLARRREQYTEVLANIREAYLMAWRRAARKLSHAEKMRFRTHHIFVTGGGSLVPEITEALRQPEQRFWCKRYS